MVTIKRTKVQALMHVLMPNWKVKKRLGVLSFVLRLIPNVEGRHYCMQYSGWHINSKRIYELLRTSKQEKKNASVRLAPACGGEAERPHAK
jgi:hypothetical protein